MRKRHLPSADLEFVTMCGHRTTEQEFSMIKMTKETDVTCKRCLRLYRIHMSKTTK
ncbi:hypothetical protein OAK07_01700 [Marine Group III euryarchaeote]|nr:hypothetical protein [Marine Group III euryarchaeote]